MAGVRLIKILLTMSETYMFVGQNFLKTYDIEHSI